MSFAPAPAPVLIRIHPQDNVAIVANDGGLPAGTALPDGLVLAEAVPQGHKVALRDLEPGEPVRRYDVVVGYAARHLPRGSWVNERVTTMPAARALDDLPVGTR
ncbi:UxaA family hydrolase, partial [Achromobacter xylosoxidans]